MISLFLKEAFAYEPVYDPIFQLSKLEINKLTFTLTDGLGVYRFFNLH
jgi:ABC-type cobalt transport system substrate-binding protein